MTRALQRLTLWVMAGLCITSSAFSVAQTREAQPSGETTSPGHVSESSAGEVGQRQSRTQAAEGIAPQARLVSRIDNRIQSRFRNRIDRNYDSQRNGISPFEIAEDKLRTATKPRQ